MFPEFSKSNKKHTVCRKIPIVVYYTVYFVGFYFLKHLNHKYKEMCQTTLAHTSNNLRNLFRNRTIFSFPV
jgi:ACR3 family arsenite efflux pump ArsB